MSSSISLSRLPLGSAAIIDSLQEDSFCSSRLLELGFYPGAEIIALFSALSGSPRAYMVQRSIIALRKEESDKITVYQI